MVSRKGTQSDAKRVLLGKANVERARRLQPRAKQPQEATPFMHWQGQGEKQARQEDLQFESGAQTNPSCFAQ
eukprot:2887586-Pyramimonas_sp.AAC.1